jgi:uncharacterized protein (TIGR04222 family)
MNPFDLRGPEFLWFFGSFAAAVLAGFWLARRSSEPANTSMQIDLSDPYLVAYLRGGMNEALRVCTVSLIDRGVLQTFAEAYVKAKPTADYASLRHPLEKLLLVYFKTSTLASKVFNNPAFDDLAETMYQQLAQLDLMPDDDLKRRRFFRFLIAGGILAAVAGVKIWVALSRGRTNLGFLVVLLVLALVAAWFVINPPRTRAGDSLLKDLRNLFSDLKGRRETIRPGGSTKELCWLAAVFGVGLIPTDTFPFARTLYPRTSSSGDSNTGFWGGTSCGSSCGSSCGGGGCGGGCGGCGS